MRNGNTQRLAFVPKSCSSTTVPGADMSATPAAGTIANPTLDQLCVNTIRSLSMDAVQAGQLRPPGHADGDGAGGLRAVEPPPPLRPRPPDLAQPRPLRPVDGPRVDAAVLDAAPERREGRQPEVRDARRAVGAARRHQAASASSTAAAPDTPSTAGPAASRRRPARSARASRPASAWRSPASGWRRSTTARASRCSTTTSTRSAATAA